MKFNEKMKLIKENAKDEIVIVKNGNFYIAVGTDAVFLNKTLEMKCSCFTKGICKVGFPISSLNKYTNELIKTGYSFVIYDINTDGTIKLIKMNMTNKKYEEENYNLGCEDCEKSKSKAEIEKENFMQMLKLIKNEDNNNKIKNSDPNDSKKED